MPIGDLCAIASGLVWSISIILMRVSGLSIPPLALNFFKSIFALLCLGILLLSLQIPLFPDLPAEAHVRLILSGIFGIAVADTMIAAALNRLGASLQALADCAYSPAIALVGFFLFGEILTSWELVGGALVISGVFVGSTMTAEVKNSKDLALGVFLAAAAHIILALSILVVRDIYRDGVSIVWVITYRFAVAVIALAVWTSITSPRSFGEKLLLGFRRTDTWKTMIPMAFFGPFLATLFWVGGFKYLPAGKAAIYNQLSTVFIILLAYFFLKEKFTKRKAIGTILAVAGSIVVALQ